MIGIHTPDSKLPNVAIMKIANYWKKRGENVEWYLPLMTNEFKKIYISKLFNFTDDLEYEHDDVTKGGTGYDIALKLPEEIENEDVTYDIYPNCDYTVQFYSRGCPRTCSFCVVPRKEGNIYTVKPMAMNPRGKWLYILDNNFFASPTWEAAMDDIKRIDQPTRFEGIDIRLLTEEHSKALSEVKIKGQIHIAWAFPKNKIDEEIKRVLSYGYLKAYKFMAYVIIGYSSTEEEDLYRVEKLRDLGVDPFVMPYNKKDPYQKRFARWVNHKAIFKTVKWEDYV